MSNFKTVRSQKKLDKIRSGIRDDFKGNNTYWLGWIWR